MLRHDTSILFATFSPWIRGKRMPTNGSLDPMRDYLMGRVRSFTIIDQPFPGSDFVLPRIERYERGRMTLGANSAAVRLLTPFLKLQNTSGTRISFKVRDFLSVLDQGFRTGKPADIFIGLECVNAIAGVILRTFGRVKRVVYYVSDYSPDRFSHGLFNRLYLWLDRIAAMHADVIWDVSRAMQPARVSAGLDPAKSAPVVYVPNGLLPEQISYVKNPGKQHGNIAYMGTLGEENGPDLAIRAVARAVTSVPSIRLHIVGGYPDDIARLTALADSLGIRNAVRCYGFVENPVAMSKILRSCYLAVAPYRAIPGSVRWYADAGKIRAYCAAGLPVISSQVPPLGKVVADAGGALVVNDSEKEFSDAIVRLLTDETLYKRLRSGAIRWAKDSTWDHTFDMAFRAS